MAPPYSQTYDKVMNHDPGQNSQLARGEKSEFLTEELGFFRLAREPRVEDHGMQQNLTSSGSDFLPEHVNMYEKFFGDLVRHEIIKFVLGDRHEESAKRRRRHCLLLPHSPYTYGNRNDSEPPTASHPAVLPPLASHSHRISQSQPYPTPAP